MADASCGPSNPLQQFRKATQNDRTLQQDRLVNRASPGQGFRSAPGPAAGNLDPEFEAFQAGLPSGPALHEPNHFPPPGLHAGPLQQQPQLPAWAADFQRLQISAPQHPTQFGPQIHQPQHQQAPSSWHQDFMKQEQQLSRAPAMQQQQRQTPVHSMFGGVPRYGVFNQSQFEPSFAERPDMTVSQGKQRAVDGGQQFDDGAFDQAFNQVDQEMAHDGQVEQRDYEAEMIALEQANKERLSNEQAEERAQQIASEIEQEQQQQFQQFEQIDAQELQQSRRNLFNMYQPGHDDPFADQHDILDQIEAEAQERFQEELQNIPEQQQDMQPPDHVTDADELSRTAAQLLDSVAHDQSEKFQQSSFLDLMRRLRDKEVRVEGDKMVEVRDSSQSFSSTAFEHLTTVSAPVSVMSVTSSPAMSVASSTTSLDALGVRDEFDMPDATAATHSMWMDWTDSDGISLECSSSADAKLCKPFDHGTREWYTEMWSQHAGWSDIADTNADAN